MSALSHRVESEIKQLVFDSSEEKAEYFDTMYISEIEKTVGELVESTNGTLLNELVTKGLLKGVTGQHRYLQNEFIFCLLSFLEQYSKLDENRFFDARNLPARYRLRELFK